MRAIQSVAYLVVPVAVKKAAWLDQMKVDKWAGLRDSKMVEWLAGKKEESLVGMKGKHTVEN